MTVMVGWWVRHVGLICFEETFARTGDEMGGGRKGTKTTRLNKSHLSFESLDYHSSQRRANETAL